MAKIVCVCGHSNPTGTHLCEKCGRPLTEEEKGKKLADMRYEGTAIRSKTYKKTIVDRIWNFFSSVKVGVSLIVITLVIAALGTFLPQAMYVAVPDGENAVDVYEKQYGFFGKVYYQIGLSDVYSSWWFQIVVGMLAISIIIASLDRGIPLYKSLKKQRVRRHESFMKRQRLFGVKEMTAEEAAQAFDLTQEKMESMKYKVRREENVLLAEKGRFARWGPYINHIGLIVFIIGVMLRLMPGFYLDKSMWIREGETAAIPGIEGYYIHNNKFIFETYEESDGKTKDSQKAVDAVNSKAKNYQSDVTLYQEKDAIAGNTDNLEKVLDYSIQVNKPLKHDGFALYQMDYRQDELKTMNFELVNKESGKSLGDISVDLTNPQKEYVIDEQTKVKLKKYYADFTGFEDGEPQSASAIPNNPAFIFQMITPEVPKGETSFVAIKQTLEPLGETKYKMTFSSVETRNASNFTVRQDKTLPILLIGGIIFMIGVTIGSYFSHRRLWLQYTKDGRLLLASHANKNWFGIKKELDQVVAHANLPNYTDQLDEAQKKEEHAEKGEGDNA
ncbi:MAG: cytochrome c biogenesis protein ResB [Kurthia sp.]|nr:cytochrome c biogenesis protein ResB [Candidatus Kurthia equi]